MDEIQMAQVEAAENVVVERLRRKGLLPTIPDEVMLVDVLLLCTECQQPIKARINTPQWIRVEWIGPAGECQACYAAKREQGKGEG